MANFLSSSIHIIEEKSQVRSLAQPATAIPGIVGLTERGPLDTPTTITSWEDYAQTFGGLYSGAEVPMCVRMFFLNGGGSAVIVRVLGDSPVTATVNLEDRDVPADTLQVDASSEGAWGNSLSIEIEAATSGESDEFNLIVLKDSVIVETWANLSMTDADANFVETVINDANTGSLYITVTDLDSAATSPADLPALTAGTPVDLASGSDGSAVDDDTFTGATTSTLGLNTLEESEITLLAIPDRATDAVQEAMITFCETTRERRVFAVMDPAASASASTIITNMAALTASESFALYWPRIKVANPDTAIFGSGTTITIPPSGAVMGMYARTDSNSRKGPFETPAGVERGVLYSVVDVETTTVNRKSTRDLVYPTRINPITSSPSGYGVFVDGSRTGLGTGNFPSVGERRGVSHLENVLYSGLQYARHSNNTPALRSSLEKTVKGELLTWCEAGAFASGDPALAFMVDADIPGTGLNNARIRAQNKVYVRVGVATAKPADYVIILVSQDTRAYTDSLS